MQTALVAGGAGFIGKHLCENLLSKNYKVICVDNFITSDKKNIEELVKNPNFKFVEHDVIKPFPKSEVEELDFVFHLASPASPNQKSPRSYINFPMETLMVNSEGTKHLLDLAKDHNAKFLFASTSEIYGDPLVSPQSEEYYGNVSPTGIRSVYDEAKRFGEAMTMAYFRKYDLDTRIVRIFNTYGPFMQIDDGRVVSNFINQAINQKPMTIYGKGSQTRSFCYVDDTVRGLELAMFKDKTKGEVFNIGNDEEKTIEDLARFIKELTESTSEIVFEDLPQDDPKVREPDISKALEYLGWKPEIEIEEGLRKTIAYFKGL